jgi:ectoine hydroxylase-related dioxygenase (phytanoyl-CoA dioxygenase family)
MQLIGNKKIKVIINQLLGVNKNSPLYITNATPIIAMPNDKDYAYKFHKDTFYTIPESNYIQIWAPLIENASIKNGALQICKKSHENEWRGQYIKKNVPNRHKYRVKENEVKKYEIINCNLKLGQVLFFDQGIAHQSGKNSSKKARISLVGVYHNIKNKNIRPMSPQYKFKGKTPEDYFKELNS